MKTLAIIFIAIATLISCKKYEEGPLISLQPKNSRIIGTWVESNIYTSINDTVLIEDAHYNIINIKEDGTFSIEYAICYYWDSLTFSKSLYSGYWSWRKNKTQIEFWVPNLDGRRDKRTINKLTKTELMLDETLFTKK